MPSLKWASLDASAITLPVRAIHEIGEGTGRGTNRRPAALAGARSRRTRAEPQRWPRPFWGSELRIHSTAPIADPRGRDTVRFIHAADIHLDSPMRGLPDYPGAPVEEIRGATRRALETMVDLALREEVYLVLIAGDLYDGDWPDYNTGLFFAHQMSRLNYGGIRVAIVQGNHDAQSQITRHLRLPDNVRKLSTKQPETVIFDGVAVHGQGFDRRHVDENVVLNYPAPVAGLFNIGMLHASAGQGGTRCMRPAASRTSLGAATSIGHSDMSTPGGRWLTTRGSTSQATCRAAASARPARRAASCDSRWEQRGGRGA